MKHWETESLAFQGEGTVAGGTPRLQVREQES